VHFAQAPLAFLEGGRFFEMSYPYHLDKDSFLPKEHPTFANPLRGYFFCLSD